MGPVEAEPEVDNPEGRMRRWIIASVFVVVAISMGSPHHWLVSARGDWRDDLQVVQSVAGFGRQHAEAKEAAARLQATLTVDQVVDVLRAMEGADPIAKNWLRGIASSVVQGKSPPIEALTTLLNDNTVDPDARYEAFLLLVDLQPQQRETLLAGRTQDPSLRLRYAAIDQVLVAAKAAKEAKQDDQAKTLYRQAVADARHAAQTQTAADALKELGETVDVSSLGGFIRRWSLVGVFDNANESGFAVAYEPETQYLQAGKLDPKANTPFAGKDQSKVQWQAVESSDPSGMVELTEPFAKAKGAIGYLYCQFDSDSACEAQIRVGSPNAHRVWINGEEVMVNEVYHSGSNVDQYLAPCKLNVGTNTILIKSCQNEMEQPWAQDWWLMVRLTDPLGKPLIDPDLLGTTVQPPANNAPANNNAS
jgi:hypothetical protein